MASSNGNATVTPATSRRNLRRGKDFFVMNMIAPLSASQSNFLVRNREGCTMLLLRRTARSHLERRALHDAHDDGAQPVVVGRCIPVNRTNQRHFRIVHSAAKGVGE